MTEAMALPAPQMGAIAWLKRHFFNTWYDAIFSIIFAVLIFWGLQAQYSTRQPWPLLASPHWVNGDIRHHAT